MCTAGARLPVRLKCLRLFLWHNLNTTEPCRESGLEIMTLTRISEPRSGSTRSARLARASQEEQSARILGTDIVAMALAAWQPEAGGCVVPRAVTVA